jgi:hypothetical protein
VSELAAEDVAEDLGVAVRVGRKAGLWSDTVFIEDANGAKVLESRGVVVRGKLKLRSEMSQPVLE